MLPGEVVGEEVFEVGAAVEEGVGVVGLGGGRVDEGAGQGTNTKTRGKSNTKYPKPEGKKNT